MVLRIPHRLDWVVTVCCLALLGSMLWNMQQGSRGIGFRDQLVEERTRLQATLDAATSSNDLFDSRVRLLRPESVDPDLIDELARRDLYLVRPNDRVISLKD